MNYRCPKHDLLFIASTDLRPPGSAASGNLKAHPVDGHPDCPMCQREAEPAEESKAE